MSHPTNPPVRVAFQGEHGAFSEAAAIQLLGDGITTVPRATFESAFRAISENAADALLAPVENSLAGSVVEFMTCSLKALWSLPRKRFSDRTSFDRLPGRDPVRFKVGLVAPMALAQCERFFQTHPGLKRVPAEDTAGSVRDVLASGEKSAAGIAGRQAAIRYGGVILSESIQDNAENFTRFVLLIQRSSTSLTMEATLFRLVRQRRRSGLRNCFIGAAKSHRSLHFKSVLGASPGAPTRSVAGRAATVCRARNQSS